MFGVKKGHMDAKSCMCNNVCAEFQSKTHPLKRRLGTGHIYMHMQHLLQYDAIYHNLIPFDVKCLCCLTNLEQRCFSKSSFQSFQLCLETFAGK